MSRLLITGATTPMGRILVRMLLDMPEVELVMATGVEAPALVPFEPTDRLHYHQIDLTRPRRLWRLLFGPARTHRINAVIHAAKHRDPTKTGARVRALNVDATRHLLSVAENHPTIERFVFRSDAAVYRVGAATPDVMDESHALNFDPQAPQWLRDRVEADLNVCARMGLTNLSIAVLRCAECLAHNEGSQLHDYLQAHVCFHPLGFDPMLNLISLRDLAHALILAAHNDANGVFNIPGGETLPLSEVIHLWQRRRVGVPAPLMRPLYWMRRQIVGTEFDYHLNQWRFHFNGILEGGRAADILGYTPQYPLRWPASRTQATSAFD